MEEFDSTLLHDFLRAMGPVVRQELDRGTPRDHIVNSMSGAAVSVLGHLAGLDHRALMFDEYRTHFDLWVKAIRTEPKS